MFLQCASDKRYHFRKCQASPLINSLESVHRWNGGFLIIENFQRPIHVFNLSYSDHCQMMTHHYWAGSMRLCSFYDDKTQKGQPVVNYQWIISNNVPFPLCIGGLEFSESQCTLYNLTRIPTILLDNNWQLDFARLKALLKCIHALPTQSCWDNLLHS